MRLLLGLALLAATPAFAAEPAREPSDRLARNCPPMNPQPAQQPGSKGGLRFLADAPPAHQFLTVDRRINGCPVPVIVRHRVDEPSPRPRR